MLKVRLMGTKNDIVWFQKILQRHPKVEVLEISELYSNKGTNKYYRAYAEVQKSNVNSPNFHNRDRYSICGGRNGITSLLLSPLLLFIGILVFCLPMPDNMSRKDTENARRK